MALVTVAAGAQDDELPNAYVGVLPLVHPHLDRSNSHKREGSTTSMDTSSPPLSVLCKDGIGSLSPYRTRQSLPSSPKHYLTVYLHRRFCHLKRINRS